MSDFKCQFSGLFLPLGGDSEKDWPNPVRLILYLMGLGWTFLGVAVISDIFMAGIEKITSSKKRVTSKETGKIITVFVWNDTVANLTLMALGSSAPEILLSLIEISTDDFFLGPLGAGTIVGSAAFNLLCISAVCVMAIPDNEVRYINQVPVYAVTSSFSVFAYLWLMFILMVTSPDVCSIWEATVTLLFCPLLVIIAYAADRGYFSKKRPDAYEDQEQQAMPDNVTPEELAQIEAEIRKEHGADLSQEQVVKIMQATYFSKHSRAFYRHSVMDAGLHGKKVNRTSQMPPDLAVQEVVGGTSDEAEKDKVAAAVVIGFKASRYAFTEACGSAKILVVRVGGEEHQATVKYATREGTAKSGADFKAMAGTLTFAAGETQQIIAIEVVDDVAYETDEEFFIDLSEPTCDGPKVLATLSEIPIATVVIIDDDLPGALRFKVEEVEIVEGAEEVKTTIIVDRFNGASGSIQCNVKADSMGAEEGIDYKIEEGVLEFGEHVQTLTIPLIIYPRGRLNNKTAFNVILEKTKDAPCQFDKTTDGGEDQCICHVVIKGNMGEERQGFLAEMKARVDSAENVTGKRNWAQQFRDALFAVGGDDDEEENEDGSPPAGPSKLDIAIHVTSIPWKLLFAFVPPPEYCGGWACFCGALFMIAVVTAIVGDMANLVGCCMDILPETAAITWVALGTSLPDTFASKAAAMMDPYADASIGNVTGSNSINVFMGIGLSWCLAAYKWGFSEITPEWTDRVFGKKSMLNDSQKANVLAYIGTGGTTPCFVTPAGTIWFNLMVFSVNAFFAIQHLYQRRRVWGGELGGPKKKFMGQYFSGCFLIAQWFIYIIASIIFARSGDGALSYGQIAAAGEV